jgi:putative ABC transport system permease protein
VLRACLTEGLVVSLCGWFISICGARLIVLAFTTNAAATIPNLQAVRLDGTAVVVSFALALFVGLVSGGVPALRALRSDPNLVLKQASESVGGGSSAFRGALVVVQIDLTVVLLVCAGLLMRTVVRVVSEERGFDAQHSLAMRLMLAQTVRFQVSERLPFVDGLVTRARALPGVIAAGMGSDLPPNGSQITLAIRIVSDDRDETLGFSYAAATPGYLEAIGAVLVKGRLFEERDRVASPPTVVITEAAARRMFRDRDPIDRDWPAPLPGPAGQRVKPRVIGVVRDIKYGGLDRPAPSTLFAIWERLAPGNAHLVVRTTGRPEELATAVRRLIQELDPAIPLFTPQTLDEVVRGSIADRRLRLQIAATFAALALGLASVALWGAVAQNVLVRRHELAVRLALGSTSAGAVGLLLRRGIVLTIAGVLLGVAGGGIAARTLRHLLHGVGPFDPPSFVAGIAVAAFVSIVACYLPARRAAAISPSELLRQA